MSLYNYNAFTQILLKEYEVGPFIGKGGFATVYKARCLRTQLVVAIKMVRLSY